LRDFSYSKVCDKLLTKEIVALLTQIHEYKGKQELYLEANADAVEQLTEKKNRVFF